MENTIVKSKSNTGSTSAVTDTPPVAELPVKNVVLVHGAFADGSGWRALYDVLTKKGYNVTIVQNPLTSLEDDVAATHVVLDNQDGPVILVGHSWGGEVITEAGNHPKVAALFMQQLSLHRLLKLHGKTSRHLP